MTSWRIIEGDCIEQMAAMPEASVDSIVCDPPYGLGFMGKAWDSLPPGRPWADQALRVLKPGGHLLAFGGTRTSHRLVVAVEDAGFEIRDTIAWLYGSGFPKGKGCLKPAHEPIVMARKRGAKGVVLNIDECRIESGEDHRIKCESVVGLDSNRNGAAYGEWKGERESSWSPAGRWPANVMLDPEAAAMLDKQTGDLPAGVAHRTNSGGSTFGGTVAKPPMDDLGYGDSGGASRFFYVAKASSAERNTGLDGRNQHPTVKPVELMRWLVRLITPEGGTVLDPFTGSGTTGIAALREGRSFIGIEREAEYVQVARSRIVGDAPLLNRMSEEAA